MSFELPHHDAASLAEDDNLLVEAVSLLVRRQRETETWVSEQIWHAEERAAATERHYADLDARLKGIEDQLGRLVHELEPNRADDERMARLREQVEDLKSDTDGRPARGPSSSSVGPRGLLVGESAVETPGAAPPGSPAPHDYAVPSAPTYAAGSAGPPAGTANSAASHAAASGYSPASPAYSPASPLASPAYSATLPAPDRAAGIAQPAGVAQAAAVAHVASIAHAGEAAPVAPASTRGVASTTPGFLDLLGATPQDRFGLILIGIGLIAVLYAILTQLHIG